MADERKTRNPVLVLINLRDAAQALAERWKLEAQRRYDDAERPGQPGEAIRAAEADAIMLDTHARELLALIDDAI